jgi:hypothetical protein
MVERQPGKWFQALSVFSLKSAIRITPRKPALIAPTPCNTQREPLVIAKCGGASRNTRVTNRSFVVPGCQEASMKNETILRKCSPQAHWKLRADGWPFEIEFGHRRC